MGDDFCEVIERLIHIRSHFIHKYRAAIMETCVETFAKAICEHGAPLDICVGFIDFICIYMCRFDCQCILQRSVYSANERKYYLINQTVTAPDFLLHLEFGSLQGITFYRESGVGAVLQIVLAINDNKVPHLQQQSLYAATMTIENVPTIQYEKGEAAYTER